MTSSGFFSYLRTRLRIVIKLLFMVWLGVMAVYIFAWAHMIVGYLSSYADNNKLPLWVAYYYWPIAGTFLLIGLIDAIKKVKFNSTAILWAVVLFTLVNLGILVYYHKINIIKFFYVVIKRGLLFVIIWFLFFIVPNEIILWREQRKSSK